MAGSASGERRRNQQNLIIISTTATLQRTFGYILAPPFGCCPNGIAHTIDYMDAEVFAFLLEQVEETKLAYQNAKRNFWEIAAKPREWPTGNPPYPEGSELFRRVLAHERFTLKAHVEAMVRLNKFLLDGTIPPDVQARLGKSKKEDGR